MYVCMCMYVCMYVCVMYIYIHTFPAALAVSRRNREPTGLTGTGLSQSRRAKSRRGRTGPTSPSNGEP